jgi:hypothetical protein
LEKEPAGAFNKAQRLIEWDQYIGWWPVSQGPAKFNFVGSDCWLIVATDILWHDGCYRAGNAAQPSVSIDIPTSAPGGQRVIA